MSGGAAVLPELALPTRRADSGKALLAVVMTWRAGIYSAESVAYKLTIWSIPAHNEPPHTPHAWLPVD